MKNRIADRMSLLHTESAFSIMARANALEAQGKSIVHLEIGQPDFKTPQNIIDAACKALNEGKTGYTPTSGITPLREAIAKHCREYKKVDVDMENVVVVPGGKPIMFYTMLMLTQPGDEVIYPNPGFPIYESVIKFSGAKPVPMPLLEKKDFRVDLEQLKRDINEKTKLIIVNNPGNPTGGVFSREDILAVADLVRDKGIYILSDEIYDQIVFEGQPLSIASLPGMKDQTVILDGFSKTFAMTGWRLGYGVMNKELAESTTLLMANSNSCAASMTQWAAIEALQGPQEDVKKMVAAFKERRDYLIGALNGIDGIHCVMPQGAFYAFPNISSFGLNSAEFADRLLEEGGVAVAGGTAFGSFGEGFIRLSYANSLENLKIAVERIADFTRKLKKN
ncbi:MAG: pyridoxal phosphate-dependent aminotransferase [Synergistaceae bacterium]|jgi:aspartate/methionine/tyrosine aminotransferase|nr:pyridoxal phosphate-dependent aminotransferase [Synergistaceae bacterium]